MEGYDEFTYYVGVLIFLVAVAGAKLIKSGPRRLLFFLALALGAVMVQLGPDGVLFMLFYRFVPGIALTRAPGRAGMIYTFAVITAAGLVWSELERASQETVQRLLGIFNKTLVWVVSMITTCAALVAVYFICGVQVARYGPVVASGWSIDTVPRFVLGSHGDLFCLAESQPVAPCHQRAGGGARDVRSVVVWPQECAAWRQFAGPRLAARGELYARQAGLSSRPGGFPVLSA